jgi:hypothetical protein
LAGVRRGGERRAERGETHADEEEHIVVARVAALDAGGLQRDGGDQEDDADDAGGGPEGPGEAVDAHGGAGGVDGGRIAGFDTGLFRRGARGLAGQWVAFSTLVVWRGANGLFQDDGRFWSGVWRRDVDERAHK